MEVQVYSAPPAPSPFYIRENVPYYASYTSPQPTVGHGASLVKRMTSATPESQSLSFGVWLPDSGTDVAYKCTVVAPFGSTEFPGIVRRVSGASLPQKDQCVSRAVSTENPLHCSLTHRILLQLWTQTDLQALFCSSDFIFIF